MGIYILCWFLKLDERQVIDTVVKCRDTTVMDIEHLTIWITLLSDVYRNE